MATALHLGMFAALSVLTTASLLAPAQATPRVAAGMSSFGVAVKASHLFKGVEKTVFEHTLSAGATHGAVTQQWHAGKSSGVTPTLRVRMYIDGEANASIDYPLFLAHGVGPAQTSGTNRCSPPGFKTKSCPDGDPGPGLNTSHTGPWGNALFGRSHDSGFYNTYLVPFGASIRITLTDPVASSSFWYMVRGMENAPLVVSGMQLPSSARLQLVHTEETVKAGTLVTFAEATKTAGLLSSFNLVINSSSYAYQEGCVSALIDGARPLWLSSGLEDYFLGAYFHSMPTEHLPYSGFQNIQPATAIDDAGGLGPHAATNSLAAFRIHEKDPVLFASAFAFQWIASSDNTDKNAGWCNYDWPAADMPAHPPAPFPANDTVSVDALAFLYVWPTAGLD